MDESVTHMTHQLTSLQSHRTSVNWWATVPSGIFAPKPKAGNSLSLDQPREGG